MNRILSFFLIFYVLIQSVGNIMANPISVSPLPLPIDGHGQQPVPLPHPIDPNPIHPVVPHKLKIHSEIGLLLIEDDVTAVKYVTTLDSRGNRMAGSSTQVIFGFPQPTGQMKPITWYSHGTNTDVQHISELSPAEAFAGVTDAHGAALLQGTSGMDIPPAGPVNPVFSPKAWQEFSKMPVGGTHVISVTEQLTNGAERQLDTRVTKRAHLRLSQAAPECKSEVVDGMDGQVCTLRTIAGQHQATSAGDMRFTLRAQFPLETGRFRIANNWHRLGEPVTIAEFANGRTLDLFIPSSLPKEGAPAVRMAQRFEAKFFSLSRQGMGDKLSLQMDRHNSVAPQPPVLGRADLLLIDDLPTARQYVTTLRSSGPQRIFGEVNGSQGVKWYTTFQQGMTGMNPLVRVSQLQPANYFKGIANGIGQLSPSVVRPTYEKGYIFPVFNDQAFSALAGSAIGQQQRLSLQGEFESGTSAPYYLSVNKKSHIKLQLPANNHCTPTEVEGAKGFICPLRLISGQGDYNGTGDVRFNLSARLPYALQQHARYRVGQAWHPVNQSITMAEFGSGQQLELFVPQDEQANGLVIGVEGHFHSASQMADSFNIAMRTRLSPVAGLKQRLNVMAIHDEPTQKSFLTTVGAKGVEISGGSANGVSAPVIKLKNMPDATIDEVTPVQWFTSNLERTGSRSAERRLSSEGINQLMQGGEFSAQVKATLHDGQRVDYSLDILAAQPLVLSNAQTGCRSETVDGVAGQVCELRRISGKVIHSDMRFHWSTIPPAMQHTAARYRVGKTWRSVSESIGMDEFAKGNVLELFLPDLIQDKQVNRIVRGSFYSERDPDKALHIYMDVAAKTKDLSLTNSRGTDFQEVDCSSVTACSGITGRCLVATQQVGCLGDRPTYLMVKFSRVFAAPANPVNVYIAKLCNQTYGRMFSGSTLGSGKYTNSDTYGWMVPQGLTQSEAVMCMSADYYNPSYSGLLRYEGDVWTDGTTPSGQLVFDFTGYRQDLKIISVTATPQTIGVNETTKIEVTFNRPAKPGEKLFIKRSGGTAAPDAVDTYIVDPDGLDRFEFNSTGVATPITATGTTVSFNLKALKNAAEDKTFEVFVQGDGSQDPGKSVSVTIEKLAPEISFTNAEPERFGNFDIGEPDILFNYGIQLINYLPSPNVNTKDALAERLVRALSIQVDVSGIKSFNPGLKNYCAFETDDYKLVPFPFYLKQENLNEKEIDCATSTSLLLSPPQTWTGSHIDTTYNTNLKARVVMGDTISQEASGMPWHGNASLNGTLTLNMVAN